MKDMDYLLASEPILLVALLGLSGLACWQGWRYRRIERRFSTLSQELRESEDSFRYLLETAHEGIAVVQNRRLVYINERMCEMTGYDKAALMALESFLPLIAPSARDTMLKNHLRRLSGEPSPNRYESLFLKRSGSSYPIEISGVLISWRGTPATLNVITDISERKAAEEAVRFLALHDSLTRLPNRHLLMERLEQALALAQRNGQPLALLFIDLNGFKQVNDTHGHAVGDRLLQAVADRLQALLRDSDTLARMGGDEFVVLMPEVTGEAGAERLMARINAALQPPFDIDGRRLHSSASVGCALFPEQGTSAGDLLRDADRQMYRAKQRYHLGVDPASD